MSADPPHAPRAARFKDRLRDLLDDPGLRLFTQANGNIRMEMDPTTVERMLKMLDEYEEWDEV